MIKVAWLTLACPDTEAVKQSIESFAGGREPESNAEEVVALRSGRWLNLELGSRSLYFIHNWCRLLSQLHSCPAVGFVAFEGLWDYSIYRDGAEIAGMNAQEEPRTFLFGDLRTGSELLGLPGSTLKAYCRSYPIPESLQALYAVVFRADWGENVRALPGDEFDPWNEWAHCDLSRHFGAKYPVEESAPIWPIRPRQQEWPSLPPRLNAHEQRRFPRRWLGLEHLHPRNWP